MLSLLPKFTGEISCWSISLYRRDLILVHLTLEKSTGFRLVTEQTTVLRILFLSSGMELYQDIFMKCLSQIQHKITDGIGHTLRKTNTGQKSLSFLGPKRWSKIGPSIKNIRTSSSLMHANDANWRLSALLYFQPFFGHFLLLLEKKTKFIKFCIKFHVKRAKFLLRSKPVQRNCLHFFQNI